MNGVVIPFEGGGETFLKVDTHFHRMEKFLHRLLSEVIEELSIYNSQKKIGHG